MQKIKTGDKEGAIEALKASLPPTTLSVDDIKVAKIANVTESVSRTSNNVKKKNVQNKTKTPLKEPDCRVL